MPRETDVHTEHCCLEHGCKYNDPKCTVTTGQKPQSYRCETCDFVTESENAREEEFRGLVAKTLEKVDSLLPPHMTRASCLNFSVRYWDHTSQWRVLIEFLADGRGFSPQIPIKPTRREALQALVDWAKGLMGDGLGTRVGQAASVLGPHDMIRDSIFEPVFREVQFKVNPHDVAINIYVNRDGTFKVAGSSSVPTAEYQVYADAFARSSEFIKAACLKPQPTPVR